MLFKTRTYNDVSKSSRQVLYVSAFVDIPEDTNGHAGILFLIIVCHRTGFDKIYQTIYQTEVLQQGFD